MKDTPSVSGPGRYPAISTASLAKVFALLVFILVAIQFNTHFWLDETSGYWTTNGGLSEIVHRCTLWPHSILYSCLLLALRSLGSHQPWVFRLPSLLAILAACSLLFRLTARLFDRQTAWLTLAIFISLPPVQFAAGDARSYALGMLCAICSTDLLVRLLDQPTYKLALAYGLVAGLVLHFHLLFCTVLVFHFCYFLMTRFAGLRLGVSYAATAALTVALVTSPLAYQYLIAAHDAKSHVFAPPPLLSEVWMTYFPDVCAIALLITGIFLLASDRPAVLAIPASKLHGVLALLWALVPVALLFVLSVVSSVHVFVPRYLLPFSPGLAICLAGVLAAVPNRLLSPLFLAVLIVLMCLHLRHPSKLSHAQYLGDWAEAFAFVDQQTASNHAPVLFRSEFPESDFMPLYPIEDSPLFSQLSFYPCHAQLIPLARTFQETQLTQLDDLLATRLNSSPRFFFMFHGSLSAADQIVYYLRGRLGPTWQTRATEFDGANVMEFYRTP